MADDENSSDKDFNSQKGSFRDQMFDAVQEARKQKVESKKQKAEDGLNEARVKTFGNISEESSYRPVQKTSSEQSRNTGRKAASSKKFVVDS